MLAWRKLVRISFAVILPTVTTLLVSGPVSAATMHQELDKNAFITMAGQSAQKSKQDYGVPPSVTVAQAILESNWGRSDKARNVKNHFGMKCHNGNPGPIATGCRDFPTWECKGNNCYDTTASFRTYASVADSFRDHGHKLSTMDRYAAAFHYTHDANQFIREVHKAGYATDPNYSNKVINIMKQYNLYRFN